METGICRLCLRQTNLQESHYLPRRAYSMNMAKALDNPNPIVMSKGKLKQVADQLRGPTFCCACEKLFNDKGERWVLANIPDDHGKTFPLQDALVSENPVLIGDEINVYAARKNKKFNMDQLIYFGMSIFWRGAAREWKSSLGAIAPPVDLGRYYEPIRQFLLGGPFPDDVAILIYIHDLKPAMNVATTVLSARDQLGEFLWFYLNGVGFKLYAGKKIPNEIRQLCSCHSPDGFVIVDREFGRMVRDFLKDLLTTENLSTKLQDFLRGPDPRRRKT
jgi:hypothetical protein